MKKMIFPVLLAACLVLTGCAFQVKNTEGLRLAYTDAEQAQSKVLQLKRIPNVTDEEMRTAENKYVDAKSKINGYLNTVESSVKPTGIVNESADNYLKISAHATTEDFSNYVNSLGTKTRSLTTSVASLLGLDPATIITKILDLQNQRKQEAINKFIEIINNNKMKEFQDIGKAQSTPTK